MKNIFKKIIAVATFIIATQTTFAQNNVGIGTNSPNASAVLDVTATDKGMLVPRMTKAQRDAIATPATGLLVYQTDNTPGFYNYNGSAWVSVTGASLPSQTGNAGKVLTTDGTNLSWGSASGAATYEVYATFDTANYTTTVGSSIILPDGLKFSTNKSPAALTGGNTWTEVLDPTPLTGTTPTISKFTATTAGLYFVDVQLVSNLTFGTPMLDFNGTGNSATSYYGTGSMTQVTAQSPHKGRGTLQRLVYMNANDYFFIRCLPSSQVIGTDVSSDGSTYIKISKLK